MQLCDDGPGDYAKKSSVYVWHDDADMISRGLHVAPAGTCKEDLDLGTVTRVVYATLSETQALPSDHVFVMMHYVPDAEEAHVTMLPVGNKPRRDEIDRVLRSDDGFKNILDDAARLCREEAHNSRTTCVTLLYDHPTHVRDSTKLAVVHDLDARVDPGVVANFLGCVSPQH